MSEEHRINETATDLTKVDEFPEKFEEVNAPNLSEKESEELLNLGTDVLITGDSTENLTDTYDVTPDEMDTKNAFHYADVISEGSNELQAIAKTDSASDIPGGSSGNTQRTGDSHKEKFSLAVEEVKALVPLVDQVTQQISGALIKSKAEQMGEKERLGEEILNDDDSVYVELNRSYSEMDKFEDYEGTEDDYNEVKADEEISENFFPTEELTLSISDIEEIEPSLASKDKIDRNKLIETIRELYALQQKEEPKNFLLNKKVVEHFRRKKSSRALHDDKVDMVYDFVAKYRKLLLRLDELKGQEEALKKETAAKLHALREEKLELETKTNANTNELNKQLRKVGLSCQSTKTGLLLPEKVIEKYIRKMTAVRDQISDVRLDLIKAQDKITALLLKTKQLEDLGDGLKVINFEQLRAEIQSLSDKIVGGNNELSKVRCRCNSTIHILAHVREKQFMLSKTIFVQEGVLRDLEGEEKSCRNYLNYIKLERDELRKKLKEMTFDCGLLDKPALLRDYDRTVNKIERVKRDIESLKADKGDIQELKVACTKVESKMIVKPIWKNSRRH